VLEGYEWHSYRLALPGGAAGAFELLKVALVLGDGAARQVLARLFEHAETAWLEEAPPRDGTNDLSGADWQALRRRIEESERPDFDAPALDEEELTYQTLVRSCAALARYSVLLTAHRLVDRGLTDGIDLEKLPASTLGATEAWMQTAPKADLRGLFMHAPQALRFIGRHPQCVPNRIPRELDEAGLLARRKGKPWRLHFGPTALQPYDSEGVRRFDP
jgi:hypothetical protein